MDQLNTLLVPHTLYANYSQLKDEFAKTLPQPTEGFAGDDEPASPVELYGKFLGFISQQQPRQDEVLRHAIRDFESTFYKTMMIFIRLQSRFYKMRLIQQLSQKLRILSKTTTSQFKPFQELSLIYYTMHLKRRLNWHQSLVVKVIPMIILKN